MFYKFLEADHGLWWGWETSECDSLTYFSVIPQES